MIWEKHYLKRLADEVRKQECSTSLITGTALPDRISKLETERKYFIDTLASPASGLSISREYSRIGAMIKKIPPINIKNYTILYDYLTDSHLLEKNIKIENKKFTRVTQINCAFYGASLQSIYMKNVFFPSLTSHYGAFYSSGGTTAYFENVSAPIMTSLEQFIRDNNNLISVIFKDCNFPSVTSIGSAFYNDSNLTTINFSGVPGDKIIDLTYAFRYCSKLTNISNFLINLGKGYTQATTNYSKYRLEITATTLTHDSMMDIINNVYDLNLTYNVSGGGTLRTQNLNFGSTNLAKLTTEEKAIATTKGWTLS